MADVQFTPGPWLVHSTNRMIVRAADAFGDASVKGNKVEADFIPLALLRDPTADFSEDETLANGFLIAAAPELYKYLSIALGVINAAGILWPGGESASNALAKARGEQVSA